MAQETQLQLLLILILDSFLFYFLSLGCSVDETSRCVDVLFFVDCPQLLSCSCLPPIFFVYFKQTDPDRRASCLCWKFKTHHFM